MDRQYDVIQLDAWQTGISVSVATQYSHHGPQLPSKLNGIHPRRGDMEWTGQCVQVEKSYAVFW